MNVVKRKVIKAGTSLAVVLPAGFVKACKLKCGDEIALAIEPGRWVQVIPIKQLDKVIVKLKNNRAPKRRA